MPLQVSLVSPEREVWSGEAEFLIARSEGGDLGVLPGHAPFLGALHHARLVITDADGQTFAAVHGGFVEVFEDAVTVLTSVAELAPEIDIDRARRQKGEAEAAINRGEDSLELRETLLRAENRLQTAGEAGLLGI